MKWFLALALAATTVPSTGLLDYQFVVNDPDEPWCAVEAQGRAEVRFVTYYNHEDPEWIGKPLALDSGAFFVEDHVAWVAPNLFPVAVRIYARPAGSGERFRNKGGCGSIPPRDVLKPPRNEMPLEECNVEVSHPVEYYAWGYYLGPDPANPAERYRYRTRNKTTEADDPGPLYLNISPPVAVEWYYRRCGWLARWVNNGNWQLAATCGEIPSW